MNEKPTSSHIGQPVRRREDLRLVTGNGSYADDVNLPGQVYAVMVRSPHAHARIRGIDTRAAMAAPGVLAVLTGRDLIADGLKPIPHKVWSQHPAEVALKGREGFKTFTAPHYPLPPDKVRFVGEAVAMVVAHTVAAAKDGGRAGRDRLRRVAGSDRHARGGHARCAGACSRSGIQRRGRRRTRRRRRRPRPRSPAPPMWSSSTPGCSASPACRWSRAPRSPTFDPDTGRTTLYAGSGGVWRLKDDLATILAVPTDAVRVIMREVGGNFGTRGMIYAEFALVAWASRRLAHAGQMDRRPPRGFPVRLPGPRPRRDRRARARPPRKFPGHARLQHQQCRRPHHQLLAAAKGRRDHDDHLPDTGRAFPRPRRRQQHLAHPPLSQRRPPRSHVCDGAADRPRLPRARLRPRRDPAPQSRRQHRSFPTRTRSA